MARNATPKQQEHSRQAAKTHGAYSVQARGKAAMNREQLSAHAVIIKQLSDRQGVIDALREHTASAILITKVVESYISGQTKAGCPLDSIPVLKVLPAFMNTASRAIALLLQYISDEGGEKFSTEYIEIKQDKEQAAN